MISGSRQSHHVLLLEAGIEAARGDPLERLGDGALEDAVEHGVEAEGAEEGADDGGDDDHEIEGVGFAIAGRGRRRVRFSHGWRSYGEGVRNMGLAEDKGGRWRRRHIERYEPNVHNTKALAHHTKSINTVIA